jgi:alkylation response protein AidB-like acyl-CoA dehydrogenase
MTFELTPDQEAARIRARAFARERLTASAAVIDEHAAIASDLVRDLTNAVAAGEHDATALVVTIEELAVVSAAAAATGALAQHPQTPASGDDSGLRGMPRPASADSRGRLIFAAVACGVARAAIDAALAVLRDTPAGAHDQEKPHWVLADAATECEAARLLTLHAAQHLGGPSGDGVVAMAKLAATRAAQQAVDAALRISGAEALVRGTLLERLTRDVRALALLMGGEEDLRAIAAQAVLPG